MNSSISPFPLENTFAPFQNVNQHLVNVDGSNWAGGFSSNESSLQFGLPAMRNNVQAAAASALQKGGRKILRRKIKNITKRYRMSKRKIKRKSIKKRMRRSLKGGYLIGKTKKRRGSSNQRGGVYHSFGSQIPNTPAYSTPGFSLGAKESALANPAPYDRIGSNSLHTNCIDNYNHFTNKGYQFW